jgi:Fe-S cluster biogenesis protein NfuA
MVSHAAVESALETLRPGLASDGFELRTGTITEDRVEVILAAKPGACLDCLVPDSLIVNMLTTAIRRNDPSVDTVELAREGFEGQAAPRA